MIGRHEPDPRTVLVAGAVYLADNGRLVCRRCAGATARYTGRDLSGQPLSRVALSDVQAWPLDLPTLACEVGCTTLTYEVGPDGWPLPKGGATDARE